jgi:hypothetical protein
MHLVLLRHIVCSVLMSHVCSSWRLELDLACFSWSVAGSVRVQVKLGIISTSPSRTFCKTFKMRRIRKTVGISFSMTA